MLGLLVVAPATAQAHLVQSGFGTFYDGAIHFGVTAVDVMVVVAFSLLGALRGRAEARSVVVALPAAWLVGGLVGMGWPVESTPAWPGAITVGAAGVLVALDVKVPRRLVAGFAALAGAVHGWSNGTALAPGQSALLALVGAASAALVLATVLAASLVDLRQPWMRIAVRVAGSWLAAISLLMAGWWLRGGG